jgi:hypothetical protein
MVGGSRSLASSLFLCSTAVLGCSVAGGGTNAVTTDAASAEGPVARDLVTERPPDLANIDTGKPDAAAAEASRDTSSAPPDAGDAGPKPPPSWMGPPAIVGVGQGGRRIVSHDGVDWNVSDIEDVKGGIDPTKNFAAVAYGNGLVVAVGGGCTGAAGTTCSGRLATFNGATWTEVPLPAGQSWLSGVAYGNGVWVAVGAGGPWLVSSDGKRWTQRGALASNLRAVAFGSVGGTMMFVTAGERGLCWRSLDGQSWTNMAQLFPNDDPIPTLHTIAIGDNVVVVGGERGRLMRSANGIDWLWPNSGGGDLTSVVYADRMFFAYVGPPPPPAHGVAWISANVAQTWSLVTLDGPGQAVATGVIDNSRLFVGATGGTIEISSDGRGWTNSHLVGAADANALYAFTFAGF